MAFVEVAECVGELVEPVTLSMTGVTFPAAIRPATTSMSCWVSLAMKNTTFWLPRIERRRVPMMWPKAFISLVCWTAAAPTSTNVASGLTAVTSAPNDLGI